jgi:hypothetical protein
MNTLTIHLPKKNAYELDAAIHCKVYTMTFYFRLPFFRCFSPISEENTGQEMVLGCFLVVSYQNEFITGEQAF